MNASELVGHLLLRLDCDLPGVDLVTPDEVEGWPAGIFDTFQGAGIIAVDAPAASVTCDACSEGHEAEVQVVESPPGSAPRCYISCPSYGRVQVRPEVLRRWRIDFAGLARATTRLLGTIGSPSEAVPQRVWDLGWAEIDQRAYEFVLVRGLSWRSAGISGLEQLLSVRNSPLVLTLCEATPDLCLNVPVVALTRMLSVLDGKLALDLRYLRTISRRPVEVPAGNELPLEEYVFRKQGDRWLVVFEGRQYFFRHSLGMEYISYLLARPNEDVAALRLVMFLNNTMTTFAPSEYQYMSREQLAEQGMSVSGLGDGGNVADGDAMRDYRERLGEIPVELDRAKQSNNTARAKELQRERDFLQRALKEAEGRGRHKRKIAGASDKARVAVTQAIARAIKHIGETYQALAAFLTNSIRTGNICTYTPDREIKWSQDSPKYSRP